jgi:L-ascorbate metabolism protein UlaG (beta-lactamase superfamily)
MKFIKSTLVLLILAQLGFAQDKKTLQWIGGPTMVLHLGSFKILTDPMLSPKSDTAFIIAIHPTTGQKNAPIRRLIAPAEFDKNNIDLLLISHPHADHVDKEAREQLSKSLHVIGPMVNKDLITGWGFTDFTGLNWTDTTVMKKGDETLTIIAVEAHHAANDPLKTLLGKGNGYIIEYRHGKYLYRMYWTGDTVWFDGMNDFTKFSTIDLMVPDMGSVGSDGKIGRRGLNASDCLHIARVLNPKNIIPVHHTTFSMYVEPISVLKDTMNNTPFKHKLHILKTGETVKL